jgi:hypothetical protein
MVEVGECCGKVDLAVSLDVGRPFFDGFPEVRGRRRIDEPDRHPCHRSPIASVAQLVERLICNQLVGGSSPFAGSIESLKLPSSLLASLWQLRR